jgi:hypothetical protein
MKIDEFRERTIKKITSFTPESIPALRCDVNDLHVFQSDIIVSGVGEDQFIDVMVWLKCSDCGACYAHGIGDNFILSSNENR